MADRELRPVDRFEWEQIILRARWTGVIPATKTRGAVAGATFRAVALAWASHGDGKVGDRLFPSEGVIAVEAETSVKTVQAVKAKLIELGLVERIRGGNRRAHYGDEYRLTIPDDLSERITVLSPAAVKIEGFKLAEKRRGKRGPQTETDPTDPDMGVPVDPPRPVDNSSMGVPVDPPRDEPAEFHGGTGGPPIAFHGGTGGPPMGVPVDPYNNPDHPAGSNNPKMADLVTQLAVVGGTGPPEDPNSRCVDVRCARGVILTAEGTLERCAHQSHAPPTLGVAA